MNKTTKTRQTTNSSQKLEAKMTFCNLTQGQTENEAYYKFLRLFVSVSRTSTLHCSGKCGLDTNDIEFQALELKDWGTCW